MLTLFGEQMPPKQRPVYSRFIEAWTRSFPGLLSMPTDGKKIKNLIRQTEEVLLEMKIEPSEDKLVEFFEIVLRNLPIWFVGKNLSTLDSHYRSIIYQISHEQPSKKAAGGKYRLG